MIRGKVAFMLCDIQEGFRPFIHNYEQVIKTAQRMIQGAEILRIPLLVTEQYRKGLGSIVSELDISKALIREDKKLFSMMTPAVTTVLKDCKAEEVVLFGIESHVCIYQTAMDLLQLQYKVHLVADGISSRHAFNVDLAVNQLRASGVSISSSESILFQIMKSAEHPQFKAISNLVKPSNI